MAKWEAKEINIWFKDYINLHKENCLPYLPESFEGVLEGTNEEVSMLSGEAINFIKHPKLKTWKIDCFFSHPEKPEFANVQRSKPWKPVTWVEFFETAMKLRYPIEMTVTGLGLIELVTVERFTEKVSSGEELDRYYTLEIKKWNPTKIETINVTLANVQAGNGDYKVQGQGTGENKPALGNTGWLDGCGWQGFGTELKRIYNYGKTEYPAYFFWLPVTKVNSWKRMVASPRGVLDSRGNEDTTFEEAMKEARKNLNVSYWSGSTTGGMDNIINIISKQGRMGDKKLLVEAAKKILNGRAYTPTLGQAFIFTLVARDEIEELKTYILPQELEQDIGKAWKEAQKAVANKDYADIIRSLGKPVTRILVIDDSIVTLTSNIDVKDQNDNVVVKTGDKIYAFLTGYRDKNPKQYEFQYQRWEYGKTLDSQLYVEKNE